MPEQGDMKAYRRGGHPPTKPETSRLVGAVLVEQNDEWASWLLPYLHQRPRHSHLAGQQHLGGGSLNNDEIDVQRGYLTGPDPPHK